MEQLYLFEIEEWRDVEGYEGLYQVSNLGRVRSWVTERSGKRAREPRLLRPAFTRKGYLIVVLYKDRISKALSVHRLVAKAFIPNLSNLPEVNHIDECKANNRADNLEWCDHIYNVRYGSGQTRHRLKVLNHPNQSKKILQFDKEGNPIHEWLSAHEIQRQLGICSSRISACCRGKIKTCNGYIWRFVNE